MKSHILFFVGPTQILRRGEGRGGRRKKKSCRHRTAAHLPSHTASPEQPQRATFNATK